MDPTLYATLRALFPEVSLKRPAPGGEGEALSLGPVVDVSVVGRVLLLTLEDGTEIRFTANLPSWFVLSSHLRTGELTFDDPELGLRRLAELLGTRREHLDA